MKTENRTLFISVAITVMLMAFIKCNAQLHRQNEDRFSIQIVTDNCIFTENIFYGGIEFQAEFSNGIYIRPQIHYAALKDGYLETSAGIGYNLAFNRWNYKAGIKLGLINRAATYPIFGFEGNLEYHITDTIGIGLRASYDKRGDADFYDGQDYVYNSQAFIKFKL
jgi:hypothetical protein